MTLINLTNNNVNEVENCIMIYQDSRAYENTLDLDNPSKVSEISNKFSLSD